MSSSDFQPEKHHIGGLWFVVWQRIATFCDADTLFTSSCVCTALNEIASYDSLWQRHLDQSIVDHQSLLRSESERDSEGAHTPPDGRCPSHRFFFVVDQAYFDVVRFLRTRMIKRKCTSSAVAVELPHFGADNQAASLGDAIPAVTTKDEFVQLLCRFAHDVRISSAANNHFKQSACLWLPLVLAQSHLQILHQHHHHHRQRNATSSSSQSSSQHVHREVRITCKPFLELVARELSSIPMHLLLALYCEHISASDIDAADPSSSSSSSPSWVRSVAAIIRSREFAMEAERNFLWSSETPPPSSTSQSLRVPLLAHHAAEQARQSALRLVGKAALHAEGHCDEFLSIFSETRLTRVAIAVAIFSLVAALLGVVGIFAAACQQGSLCDALIDPETRDYLFTLPGKFAAQFFALPSPYDRFWIKAGAVQTDGHRRHQYVTTEQVRNFLSRDGGASNWVIGNGSVFQRNEEIRLSFTRTYMRIKNQRGVDDDPHPFPLFCLAEEPHIVWWFLLCFVSLSLAQLLVRNLASTWVASRAQFLFLSPALVMMTSFRGTLSLSAAKSLQILKAEIVTFFCVSMTQLLWAPVLLPYLLLAAATVFVIPAFSSSDGWLVKALMAPLQMLARLFIAVFIPELANSVARSGSLRVVEVVVKVVSRARWARWAFAALIAAAVTSRYVLMTTAGTEENNNSNNPQRNVIETNCIISGNLSEYFIPATASNRAELSLQGKSMLALTAVAAAIVVIIDIGTLGTTFWTSSLASFALRCTAVVLLAATLLSRLRFRFHLFAAFYQHGQAPGIQPYLADFIVQCAVHWLAVMVSKLLLTWMPRRLCSAAAAVAAGAECTHPIFSRQELSLQRGKRPQNADHQVSADDQETARVNRQFSEQLLGLQPLAH